MRSPPAKDSQFGQDVSSYAVRFLKPRLPDTRLIQEYFDLSEAASQYSNRGPCHELLIHRIEAYLGAGSFVSPTSSGTTGLQLALKCLITSSTRRRRVLIPSFTFPALIGAVQWLGLTPVFVDIEDDGWHLDPNRLERAIAKYRDDLAAVVTATTFGVAPEVEISGAWRRTCEEAEVPLVVDSAAGFGSRDESGNMLGCLGDAEVFSFHATKTFCVGEGGLVNSPHRDIRDRVASLSNFGLDETRVVEQYPGINGKMGEWAAATALARLDEYDKVLAQRRSFLKRVVEAARSAGFHLQPNLELSSVQFIPLLAPSVEAKEDLIHKARRTSIELRFYYETPLHQMQAFNLVDQADTLEVSEAIARRIVSLPMGDHLSEYQLGLLCELFS